MQGLKILVLGLGAELKLINQALRGLFEKDKSLRGRLGPVMVDMELPREEVVNKFDWILAGESRANLLRRATWLDHSKVLLFSKNNIEEFIRDFPNLICNSSGNIEEQIKVHFRNIG